jgi:hypothetical protein
MTHRHNLFWTRVMKKLIVLLVALGALLSACTGQIRIQDGHDGNEGGGFCPPGQAKKGNC